MLKIEFVSSYKAKKPQVPSSAHKLQRGEIYNYNLSVTSNHESCSKVYIS